MIDGKIYAACLEISPCYAKSLRTRGSRLIFLFLFFSNNLFCQEFKHGNNWMNLFGTKMNFNYGLQKIQGIDLNLTIEQLYSSSFVSDSNGQLLFGTDGVCVFSDLHTIIQGGDSIIDGLMYNEITTNQLGLQPQSSLIIPKKNNQYYVFTSSISDSMVAAWGSIYGPADRLYYNVIDMDANNGQGKVIEKRHQLLNMPKYSNSVPGVTACRHANGKDWWLFRQMADTFLISKFLVTADSIYGPYFQSFDLAGTLPSKLPIGFGQAAFNTNGTKYAVVNEWSQNLYLMDFDRSNGLISNLKIIQMPSIDTYASGVVIDSFIEGIAFSPNDRFIYVSKQSTIMQLDLLDTNKSTNLYKKYMVDANKNFYGLLNLILAPDCKIYIGNADIFGEMSVIENPDEKGAACNICNLCITSDTDAFIMPNMPNYRLGKLGDALAPCSYPLSNVHYSISPNREYLSVYPNPANSVLYMQTTSKQKRELYNYIGQLLFTTAENKIDVSKYPRGLYFVKCGAEVIKVILE
jgi:hypothetical protein